MSLAVSCRWFLGLCGLSVLIWWRVLLDTFRVALRNDAYTHILLIIPVSVTLIVLRVRRNVAGPTPSRAGLVLLALAVLIGCAGLWFEPGNTGAAVGLRWTIEMLAVVVWWIGAFVASFGPNFACTCAFPLLFLLWLVPIPEWALAHVIGFLQHGTASVTRAMFAAIAVPVTQNGTVVTVPGLSVEVAEECSSIRSSMMLVVLASLLAGMMVRSCWGRLIVLALAMPLAVAKNALRVFTLEALGAYVNPGILNGPLHQQGGIVFLIVGVVALFAIVYLVLRLEVRMTRAAPAANLTCQ